MKKNTLKNSFFVLILISLFLNFFIPAPIQASVFDAIGGNLRSFNSSAQLPQNNTLVDVIINIINTALSFLGLVFVCLVLYAGFLYMTGGGNPKQIDKAKDILKNAATGIAIIFVAYVFVNFVITKIIEVIKTA